ncbi:hypothetical protein PIROE2DRAFT_4616, partial [Piromyces sp. E2]
MDYFENEWEDTKKIEIENQKLINAVDNNTILVVDSVIQKANGSKIILPLNQQNEHSNGNYPILMACKNNNSNIVEILIEYAHLIIKLLLNYATENKCELALDEKDMKNVSELNDEIIKLLIKYETNIKISYTTNKTCINDETFYANNIVKDTASN